MSQMAEALLKVGLVTKKQVDKSEARKRFVQKRIRELNTAIKTVNSDISKLDETLSLSKVIDPLGLKDFSGVKKKKDKLFSLVNEHIWELEKLNKEIGK